MKLSEKVTESQIQQIHNYIERCRVDWYDVQIELVDHMANGIENQWESNSSISFNDALDNEFKKFGLSGFQNLIEEKRKGLNKHYRKQVWFYVKEFFTLPKMLLTLFLVWVLFSTMHYIDNKDSLMTPFVFIIFGTFILHIARFKISIYKRKKKTGKIWLFENNIYELGGLGFFLNIGIWHPILFNSNRQWTNTSELIVSICIVLYLFFFFVSVVVIPKKLKEKMSKQYSDYNFA